MDGGFAEYCAYPAGKVFKIHNLSDVDATLLEPASCAAHGLDKIAPKLGSSVLMFGAGPTGLGNRNEIPIFAVRANKDKFWHKCFVRMEAVMLSWQLLKV
jgi:hypothetical protein